MKTRFEQRTQRVAAPVEDLEVAPVMEHRVGFQKERLELFFGKLPLSLTEYLESTACDDELHSVISGGLDSVFSLDADLAEARSAHGSAGSEAREEEAPTSPPSSGLDAEGGAALRSNSKRRPPLMPGTHKRGRTPTTLHRHSACI